MGHRPFLSFFFLFSIIQPKQDPMYFKPDPLAFETLTASYLFYCGLLIVLYCFRMQLSNGIHHFFDTPNLIFECHTVVFCL